MRGGDAPARRDAGVETLRGLAILLMVGGHVVGTDGESGLRVADDSGWRYACYTLAPLRMPLFTAISGFVYALRPVAAGRLGAFRAGTSRRLLLPLLTIGLAFVLLRQVTPGVNAPLRPADLPWLLVIPYAHFWYVYALAWVFLLVGVLDAYGLLETRSRWGLMLAGAFALMASGLLATPVLGIGRAQYLLPYFILGVGVGRFGPSRDRTTALALTGLGAVGLIAHQGGWFGWWRLEGLREYLATSLLGAVAVVLLLSRRRAWRPLAALGAFSYGIYLMHVFGTAGARIVLQRAGVESVPVLAIAGLCAGLALPVVVERFAAPRPRLALLLLGQRPRHPLEYVPHAFAPPAPSQGNPPGVGTPPT